MKTNLPILPASLAISAMLILSSCGKQEAVGDVPSGEELAKQADAASAAIREEAAKAEAGEGEEAPVVDSASLTTYTNALRGYTIMVPKNWATDDDASDDNGNVYNAPESNAKLAVTWVENREDAAMKAAMDSVQTAGEAMTSENVSDDEFRASGQKDDSTKSMLRIFRKPDGTMVSARIDYPVENAKTIDPLAKQVIDSLALQ